jgi:hypothetical protein
MKYLKLYEDFNNQDDILEDIKWIMIEVGEDAKLIGYVLDGDLVTYKLSDYNVDDLRVANKRLQDIGYTLLTHDKDYKNICLIINTKLMDLSKYYDDYILKTSVLDEIRKKLLFKYFEKTPNLFNIDTSIFMLPIEECYDYLSEFLGKDGISKNLHEIVGNEYHITDGGYDYDFTLENIEQDGDEFRLKVYIFDEGIVEIIYSGDEMNIIDAITDKEIGWEIKGEMEYSIIRFLRKFVGDISDFTTIEIVY